MDWEMEDEGVEEWNWDEEWDRGNVFWHNDMVMTSDLFPFVYLD